MKRSGPSFRQQKIPLKECPDCSGQGMVQGLFHQMPCPDCESSGFVCKETGATLPLADVVLQLRLLCNELEEERRELRRKLFKLDDRSRGHGPMGTQYTGD